MIESIVFGILIALFILGIVAFFIMLYGWVGFVVIPIAILFFSVASVVAYLHWREIS